MVDKPASHSRSRRVSKPLDSTRLEELAVAYVARFATTAARLESYLSRKLRERGWAGDDEPPVGALVEKFVARGYIDDAVYGRAKANDLTARGYGARRVAQALHHAGVDEEIRDSVMPNLAERRGVALAYARKRRFGPCAAGRVDDGADGGEAAQRLREKQLAAMVRAGHDFDAARVVLDAVSVEEIEEWVAEAEDE